MSVTVTQETATITVNDGTTVTASKPVVTITSVAKQGPEGIPGPSGAATLACTAGANLSGDRIVTYDSSGKVVYASCDAVSALTVLGITLAAAAADDSVSVQSYGQISEPSWSWIPLEPVYLSTNGTITQTAPTSGYCVRLGWAVDAHTLMLAIEPALKLA